MNLKRTWILILIIGIVALVIFVFVLVSQSYNNSEDVGGGRAFFRLNETEQKCDLVIASEKQLFLYDTEDECKLANNIK